MHGRNNYQILRKLKRLGIANARQDINEKLDKLLNEWTLGSKS